MISIAKLILVTLLVIITVTFGAAVIFASTEVGVVAVIGGCDQGNVVAKITLFNGKEQDEAVKVVLRLTQLVPLASEFTLVEEMVGEVVVFAGEEGAASHVFPTSNVDRVATELRIETGAPFTAVSESFSPCFQPLPTLPSPVIVSPVPTATPTRISETMWIERPQVTPETRVVVGLPSSGTGGDEEFGWISLQKWLGLGVILGLIAFGFSSKWVYTRLLKD